MDHVSCGDEAPEWLGVLQSCLVNPEYLVPPARTSDHRDIGLVNCRLNRSRGLNFGSSRHPRILLERKSASCTALPLQRICLGCTLCKVDKMGRRGYRKASKVTEKLGMPACFLSISHTVPSLLYE